MIFRPTRQSAVRMARTYVHCAAQTTVYLVGHSCLLRVVCLRNLIYRMELDIENLICEVQKRRYLYDTTTSEYSDRNLKRKLWEEVCVQLVKEWNILELADKIKQGKFVIHNLLKIIFSHIAMELILEVT